MNTKLDFKIQTDYEVIGQGGMIYSPCQIGDWWVVPAKDYRGVIPTEIQSKMFEFVSQRIPFHGFLIAEDMRDVEAKLQQEKQKKEEKRQQIEQVVSTGFGILRGILSAVFIGVAFIFSQVFSYDPMLIAVLEDGRWICLGTWYD